MRNNLNYKIKINKENFYDFVLSDENLSPISVNNTKKILDFSDIKLIGNKLYTPSLWNKSISNGVILKNIGFTGVDNGFIQFDKDIIDYQDFVNLFCKSTLIIDKNDVNLILSPVSGNTKQYEYPIEINTGDTENYISYKGGFHQGFFKLDNMEYQILPNVLEEDWTLSFDIRPQDYEVSEKTINYKHPENKGIFFFIGTRAENKFYSYYKVEKDVLNSFDKNDRGECEDLLLNKTWLQYEPNACTDTYFIETEYVSDGSEVCLDSEGHEYNKKGYKDIKTNNKFLMFDRTKMGVTVDTWQEGTELIITDRQDWKNFNYYTLLDRTDKGFTAQNINEYNEYNSLPYDVYSDIRNNAFALRITDDGSIGYRYAVSDCNEEFHFKIEEEYSKRNIIKLEDWNNVIVKISSIKDKNKMRLYFYVNKKLIFISKELNKFNFKNINDVPQKQETVPYNISLGGGTQGLIEQIEPNYFSLPYYILPLEKYFCGTFIGDIKNFKFYEGVMDFYILKKYL